MKYQESYLDQALKELGVVPRSIQIDHYNGVENVQFGLIFPISLISMCRGMWKEKRDQEYFFQGLVTPERAWINDVPKAVIINSIDGRHRNRNIPDLEYYQSMVSSKFILCPTGDCVWSYRFFEAIMCGAMPVVNHAPHEQESKFHFLQINQSPHMYDLAKVQENFDLLVGCHTLQPNNKIA